MIARIVLAALLAAGAASAEEAKTSSTTTTSTTTTEATRIASQPARDVGASKVEIPPILQKAAKSPYSLTGLKTCAQISGEVEKLNTAIGRDFVAGNETKEDRKTKLAEAGGQTIVNSLIPFRGLVREISGAAPAERRLAAAVQAGYARRGFLRGVHLARACKTRI